MALTARTKRILNEALADKVAGNEVSAAVNASAAADALDLGSLSSTGLVARTGSGTSAVRTVTGTANQVSVANGNGASGNPTISLPASIDITTSYKVAGTKVLGAQGALIADITPEADGTIAGTTINAILARMRAHGMIASS